MNKIILSILVGLCILTGCATRNKHPLIIETTPPDALVSFHQKDDFSSSRFRVIAGTTPLESNFDFGKKGQLRLEIEKRGYIPRTEDVSSGAGKISINLERIQSTNGEDISNYALPDIKRVLLAAPDLEIIERGFSSEKISEEKSGVAQEKLTKGIVEYFADRFGVVPVESSDPDQKLLRPIWRDVQSAMELLDPVRVKYVSEPPVLETKSGREAAATLGNKYGAEVILFIKGKRNIESGGFTAGVAGAAVAGSVVAATSAAYSKSPGNRDPLEQIYAPPEFKSDTAIIGKAVLVNCSNGEILWLNRGPVGSMLTNLFGALGNK